MKKLLWLVILILIAACSVYAVDGGLTPIVPTPTALPTDCVNCTIVPTTDATVEVTSTIDPTSETVAPTEGPTDPATPEATGIVTTTPTDLPTDLPTETFTPEPTLLPTETATPLPSPTFTPTATAVPPTATATATMTATATSVPMTFAVQSTTPVFMVNFVHTTEGCKWQGVAGQVFDKKGNPLTNYVVKITGTYNSAAVSLIGVTGMVSGTPYGPGSYEIVLGTTPINSVDLLSIQVFDPAGKALTDPLKFSTSSDCSKNLVIINFKEK